MDLSQFNKAFDEYRMPVFNFCNKLVNDRQGAEDITVSVFLKLWAYRDRVAPESLKAFLMITAKRKSLDYNKTRGLRKYHETLYSATQIEAVFDSVRIESDVMKYISSVIEALPPREREIVKLKYLDGLTNVKIAGQLGLSVQTVGNLVHSALKHLRAEIKVEVFKNLK